VYRVFQRTPLFEPRTRKPLAGACSSQSTIKPPIARGSIESIAIQGRGSSGRGFQPEPYSAAGAAKSGSALDAVAVGASAGLQSSISTSAIQTVPLPPSPATTANSIEPSAERRAAARRAPGKIDVPAVHPHPGPAQGKPQVLIHVPPDVLTRAVDQLQFQMISPGRDRAGEIFHRVLLRHPLLQRAARDDKASTPFEIEIHLQRRYAPREYRSQLQLPRCLKRWVAIRTEWRIRRTFLVSFDIECVMTDKYDTILRQRRHAGSNNHQENRGSTTHVIRIPPDPLEG